MSSFRSSLFFFGLAHLIGWIVLTGWITGSATLTALRPEYVTMKLSTAVCFILTTLMLAVLCVAFRPHAPVRPWALIFVPVIASVITSEIYGTEDLPRLHQVLAVLPDSPVQTTRPYTPSLGTLALFTSTLLVSVIPYFYLGDIGHIIRWTGASIASVSILAIVGYAVAVPPFYLYVAGYSSAMALSTAVAFLCIGLGCLCYVSPEKRKGS